MVTINIEKRHLYLLTAVMVFLVGVGLVFGGSYTSPTTGIGHDFDELENVQFKITEGLTTCAGADKSIKTINPATGVVTCETDDVGGESSLDCEIQTCINLNTAKACTVSCSEGYRMTGVTGRVTWDTEGSPNFKGAYPNPSDENTWTCQFGEHTGSATCYLRCCKIF